MQKPVPQQILHAQYSASQPATSSWVSANAGAGKTYVLAQRVIRLLMNGVAPQQILCLTYTKAAAAEMKRRIAKILAQWTQLDDATLESALRGLNPDGGHIDITTLKRARALFALSVETPGGLNVQTFHGFCERILHQFPLEADVPVQFSQGEEQLLAQWQKQALASILLRAQADDGALGAAYDTLVGQLGAYKLEPFILNAVGQLGALDDKGIKDQLKRLAGFLGLKKNLDLHDLIRTVLKFDHLPVSEWPNVADTLDQFGKNDQKLAHKMRAAHQLICAEDRDIDVTSVFNLFLKKDHTPAQRPVSKAVEKEFPELAQKIHQQVQRLADLALEYHGLMLHQHAGALLHIAHAAQVEYARLKQQRAVLDFDDLIAKMEKLVAAPNQVGWVHYKIDQGIDHVLIDEAQDTSPQQWHIIQGLVAAFFDGAEAHTQTHRTLFAVGDQKQSIYSFQGARPELFTRMRYHFEQRSAQTAKPFARVPMQHSFRSLPPIMGAVDKVFGPEIAHRDLSAELGPPVHMAVRDEAGGHVEIWPVQKPAQAERPSDWKSALEPHPIRDPNTILARQIAATIADWLEQGRLIANREQPGQLRPVTPGDVMILVQRRSALFDAILTQLGDLQVPTAGADRLILQDHIIVQDLLALGQILVLIEDDLSLATVLKSPLFGLDEQELFDVCHGRQGSVWAALNKAALQNDKIRHIVDTIRQWRAQVDVIKPFDLFSQILSVHGARARYVARFSGEAEDVCAEFLRACLAYETGNVPSLAGFVHWLSAMQIEIKREFDQSGVVRVMTVHGAKGLEAPIVFLADAARVPRQQSSGLIALELPDETDFETPVLWGWVKDQATKLAPVHKALERAHQRADAEYRRLLYVAMTRAENELYICGSLQKNQDLPPEKSWYHLIHSAFETEAAETARKHLDGDVLIWPADRVRTLDAEIAAAPQNVTPPALMDTPAWLTQPAEKSQAPQPILNPSKIKAVSGHSDIVPIEDALSGLTPPNATKAGTLMHALLQHLPDLAPKHRQAAGEAIIAESDLDVLITQHLLSSALSLIANPNLARIFADNSKAEVPFHVTLDWRGAKRQVQGVIDRLVIGPEKIHIIDFKSGAYVPTSADQVPDNYKQQLGLYVAAMRQLFTDHHIKAALLYTRTGDLIELDEESLILNDEAFTLA